MESFIARVLFKNTKNKLNKSGQGHEIGNDFILLQLHTFVSKLLKEKKTDWTTLKNGKKPN